MASAVTSLNGNDLNNHILKRSFNLKTSRKDGLLIQIHNTTSDFNGRKKCYRFVNLTFNDTSEQIAASDQAGNVFIVDFLTLKFWQLYNLGYCSTLAYSTYKKNELLIGKDDGAVQLVNTDTSLITDRLVGHKIMVNWISFTTEYPYCLTATINEALIWNLKNNTQIHQLTLHTTIKLKQVRFIPTSNNIFASFEDDTLQIWKFGTFQSVLQIFSDKWENHQLKALAFSRNGQVLVVGGQTSILFVISLKSWEIRRKLFLPDETAGVNQLEFLSQPYDGGKNKILLALTSSCVVHFLNVIDNVILLSVKLADVSLHKLKCSENGRYTAFVLDTGELNIYSTDQLFPNISTIISSNNRSGCKNFGGLRKKKFHLECTKESQVIVEQKRKQSSEPLQIQKSLRLQNQLKNQIASTLHINKLRQILKEFGEFPESYRLLIWKNILKLPNNKSAFEALVSKGNHIVSEMIDNTYPLESKSVLNGLKRLISCLCHWSPLFTQVSYLPLFVFPFVRAIKNDPLACFEIVATVFVNWCQRWFEFFPFPPVNVLSLIENVLCEWDEELLLWFIDHQITSHVYAWPILETAFSEVLSGQEWLQLFDNILSNEPSFIIFAVVGYNIMCRSSLLKLINIKEFELFYKSQTAIDMKKFIGTIYHMSSQTKKDNHPRNYLKPFSPLVEGDTYQVFKDYPKLPVDGQAEQANEMRMEELKLLKEQARLANARLELERDHEKVIQKQIQNSQLCDLESKYEEALKKEEERLAEHRHKVMNMRKELKHRENQLLNETREMILQQNAEKRKIELEALLKDIDQKRMRHEIDIKEEEEELREQFELLMNQKKNLQFQFALMNEVKSYPLPQHKYLQEQQKQLICDIRKLKEKVSVFQKDKRIELTNKMADAEDLLQSVECHLAEEMGERQNTLIAGQKNIEVLKLHKETADLGKQVTNLMEKLINQKLKESREKECILRESVSDRKILLNEQSDIVQSISDVTLRRPSVEHHDRRFPSSSSSPQSSYLHSGKSDDWSGEHDHLASHKSNCKNIPILERTCKVDYCNDDSTNNFLIRSGEFYRREQQTIKSCMDLREKLLHNRR